MGFLLSIAINREKKTYLSNRIHNNDPKNNWKLLRDLGVHSNSKKVIPEQLGTADEVNDFFANSAQSGDPDPNTLYFYRSQRKQGLPVFGFRLATIEEVRDAVCSIKSEAIGCDEIGRTMLNLCGFHILPIIVHLINVCIETKTFPECWKTSYVLPLPKTNSPNELKDLRPISILPTLSKVMERVLDNQIREHIANYNILPSVQSGFRKGYSCTTALLMVTDDVLEASDRGELTALILLDYSKAFDCLNHGLLLSILNYLGFDDDSQHLIGSYLSRRNQIVKLNGKLSRPIPTSCGVPQGSILGPLLFSLYTSQMITYLRYSKAHFYADDTQLYFSFKPKDIADANNKVAHDMNVLMRASEAHCLSINPSKSQVLLFGRSLSRTQNKDLLQIIFNNEILSAHTSAKNLGLLMDTDFRFSGHISNCIKRAFVNLKLIFNQRDILSGDLRKMLCDSLVLSHFNYCDALYGPCLLDYDSRRIQLMQNSCVRLIGGIRRHERGIGVKLREINWLRMNERRVLHSLVLFNKIICSKRPDYLYNKIKFRYDVHNLELRRRFNITPPIHVSAMYERSFSYQVSKLYNKIPLEIRTMSSHNFRLSIGRIIDRFL